MMKNKFLLMSAALLLISCGGMGGTKKSVKVQQQSVVPANFYDYRIVETYPHKTDSYTQGLIYHNGRLIEGTGLVGESRILEVDIKSGETKQIAQLKGSHFGEGITILGDTLYQLTWQTNRLFMYNATSGELLGEKIYPGEGWGITNDGESLYVSDGSSIITVRNPATFKIDRKMLVTFEGEPVEYINELEWVNGKIWANVYTLNQIIIINPQSGAVEGVVELKGILPEEEKSATTDVLNGIAYDAQGDRLFVTGKNWSKLFEIKIIKR